MVRAFVDGSIAGGVVNVALYASLLLMALFLRTHLAHQGAHFLLQPLQRWRSDGGGSDAVDAILSVTGRRQTGRY